MKYIFRIALLAVVFLSQSCERNELENIADLSSKHPDNISTPSALNTVDYEVKSFTLPQFGPNSYWTSTIVSQGATNFVRIHHNRSANLFGLGNVPLYFAGGDGTFNALSLGAPANYIVWGEEMLEHSLSFGRAAVAYIAAHEIAHQVQFRQGFPSVNGPSTDELEADGFAGYYLKKRYSTNWSNVSSAYNFAQSIGGADGSLHGTPAQRRSALRLGWLLAKYDLSNYNLDRYFFYYYDQYVKAGALKPGSQPQKPNDFSQKIHDFILSKVEELIQINSGALSAEEFTKLQ